MNTFPLKYYGIFFLIISFFSFFNIIYSYYFDLLNNLNNYILIFFITLFVGLFLVIFKKYKFEKISLYQRIITVLSGYIILPIAVSLPYYLCIENISLINCYFEAISGFTSTGFTIFNNLEQLDQTLIMWRSGSQWIGGLYFLFSIIFLIDIYDESLKKTLTNFLSFSSSEILKQTIKIFLLYSSLTIFIFIVLNILGIRTFNSLNLAMTVISSGGFLPDNELSSILITNTQIIVFSLLMLLSFFSIFFIYNLIFFRKRNLNFFYEDIHLFSYFLIIVSIFFIFFSYDKNFSLNFLN